MIVNELSSATSSLVTDVDLKMTTSEQVTGAQSKQGLRNEIVDRPDTEIENIEEEEGAHGSVTVTLPQSASIRQVDDSQKPGELTSSKYQASSSRRGLPPSGASPGKSTPCDHLI